MEYVYRVIGYLVSCGGVAVLTYWLAGVVGPIQSRIVAASESEDVEG